MALVVCPTCGAQSPDHFRFCPACAAPLDSEHSASAEERKLVSILFVDLVGFTARSHRADPEDVRAVLAPYHRLLKTEIERFGGTVEKFIGDAVMAVFGAPVAHEDDAERAVRAALRIVEAIEEMNNSDETLDLSIRAGVNTGEGLAVLGARAGSGEPMVTGDVVNTASRLQTIAPVNGVAVGEITFRLTSSVIEYEQLDAAKVKGKPDPMAVWHAVGARSRFGIDLDRAPSSPFIGRERDLESLKSTFRRTVRESSTQLVTIIGEPGIGKSRLVSEFFRFIDTQEDVVLFRQGRSLPYGEGITFWALGEIVKAQAGILESDSPAQAARKLRVTVEAVLGETSEHDWFFARLAPLVGAVTDGPSAEREESFTAWRRFLQAVATFNPLIAVFEDLHWADEALLEFIQTLVKSTDVPLLVLCTARPELFDKSPDWGSEQRKNATVTLDPLDKSETARLVSGLLERAVLPAEAHTAVLDRAGGNPLFAEEFVRMLSDRGVINEKGRVLTIDAVSDMPMPDTLQSVIGARIDTLARDQKALMHDAAVSGKVFWSGALSAIGGIDTATANHALGELVRKELVRPARASSIAGEHEYVFWHALIRDVCYGQIPRAARADKHCAMAGWLEGIAGDRVLDHAEVLAHHYTQALELTRAARRRKHAAELEEPAMRFLAMAGDRALNLDPGRAETYYRRALALSNERHADRARVLFKAGEATASLGRFVESAGYLEDAISVFRSQGDLLGQARGLVHLNGIAHDMGDTSRARRLLREAIELLEPLPRGRQLCSTYAHYAGQMLVAGLPSEALGYADKALSLGAELGDREDAALALGFRGAARCELGDTAGLLEVEEALRQSLDLGIAEITALNYGNLAFLTSLIHGPARALELFRNGMEFAKRRGLDRWALQMQNDVAWANYEIGDWDQSFEQVRHVIQWGEEHDAGMYEVFGLVLKTWLLLHRGDLENVIADEQRILTLARKTRHSQVLVSALVTAAAVRTALSDRTGAIKLVKEMAENTTDQLEYRARELPAAIRALVSAERPDLAAELIPTVSSGRTPLSRHCIVTGEAIVKEAEGHFEEASYVYKDAADRWADHGIVLEEAQALLGRGRCFVALGDQSAATDCLEKARAIFARLEAVPLLLETEGHLHATKTSLNN